jgi:hypothetical protein
VRHLPQRHRKLDSEGAGHSYNRSDHEINACTIIKATEQPIRHRRGIGVERLRDPLAE